MKTRTIIFIFIGLALLSTAALVFLRPPQGTTAAVYRDGVLLQTIDLAHVQAPYTVDLGGNTLLVEQGAIAVCDADCPDRLCVKRGKITTGAYPIICLPHRLTITITGNADIDGVTGW